VRFYPQYLEYLVGVEVGHLVVELGDLIDDHGDEDPAEEDEGEAAPAAPFLPGVLLFQAVALLQAGLPVDSLLGVGVVLTLLVRVHFLLLNTETCN
jgi:hypothetical protein